MLHEHDCWVSFQEIWMSTWRPFLKILAKWEVAQRMATDNCISASVMKTQQDRGDYTIFSHGGEDWWWSEASSGIREVTRAFVEWHKEGRKLSSMQPKCQVLESVQILEVCRKAHNMDPRKQSIDRPLTHRYPVNEETHSHHFQLTRCIFIFLQMVVMAQGKDISPPCRKKVTLQCPALTSNRNRV